MVEGIGSKRQSPSKVDRRILLRLTFRLRWRWTHAKLLIITGEAPLAINAADSESWRHAVAKEVLRDTSSFESFRTRARHMKFVFHDELASRLSNLFSSELSSRLKDTDLPLWTIAEWANSELRALGLAIQCTRTGRPATFVVTHVGKARFPQAADQDPSGRPARVRGERLGLEVKDENGRPFLTVNELDLDLLQLIGLDSEDPARPFPLRTGRSK